MRLFERGVACALLFLLYRRSLKIRNVCTGSCSWQCGSASLRGAIYLHKRNRLLTFRDEISIGRHAWAIAIARSCKIYFMCIHVREVCACSEEGLTGDRMHASCIPYQSVVKGDEYNLLAHIHPNFSALTLYWYTPVRVTFLKHS